MSSMNCVGCDVFLISPDAPPKLPAQLGGFQLEFVSNRGSVLPESGDPDFLLSDWYRARYRSAGQVSSSEIWGLLEKLGQNYEWEKVQKLYQVDGQDAFSSVKG